MIIEFAGLPGTGKTTLVNRLSSETGIPLERQSTLGNNLFTLGYFLIVHPCLAFDAFKSITRQEPTPWRYKLRLFKGVFPAYLPSRRHTTFFLDEGLIHRFIGMASPMRFARAQAFVKRVLGREHLLVVTTLPESILAERLEARGKVLRAGKLNDEEREQWQKEVQQNTRTLIELASSHPRVLVVDTQETDRALEQIKTWLNSQGVL